MKKVLCIAGVAVLMTAAVSQAGVLYQSDFTGSTVASAGLTSTGVNSGIWNIDTVNDRLKYSASYSTSRATVKNTGGFQSDSGITLDVTFNQLGAGSKFSIGLADVSTGAWNNGNDFIQDGTYNAPYSIALSTDGALEDANGNKDVLSFNNGSTVSKLSDAQGGITFGEVTTLSLTITSTGYSYSLNGVAATIGSGSFDMSKSYMFVAYGNRGTASPNAAGSYISNITMTSPPSGTVISIQ